MRKTLIVGAGFTGAVLAERIASQLRERVVVIDQRPHVAGNAYDCLNEHGVLIHKYGPHIFHTNAARIFEYLSGFTAWTPYEHRVKGLVNGAFVPLPFNLTSMELVFGMAEGTRLNTLLVDEYGLEAKVPILKMRTSKSPEIRKISDFIYENVFFHYTSKQWGMPPEDLDPSVSSRVPVLLSRDDRYFQDTFQFMPTARYAPIFGKLLADPIIEVRTDVRFQGPRRRRGVRPRGRHRPGRRILRLRTRRAAVSLHPLRAPHHAHYGARAMRHGREFPDAGQPASLYPFDRIRVADRADRAGILHPGFRIFRGISVGCERAILPGPA